MAYYKEPTLNNIKAALKSIGYADEVNDDGYFDSPDNPETKTKTKTQIILNFPSTVKNNERADKLKDVASELRKRKINCLYSDASQDLKKSSAGILVFSDSNFHIIGKVMALQLKPSNIKPSIVNDWMTPEKIVDNVIQYLKDQSVEGQLLTRIQTLLKLTIADNNTSIPFSAPKNVVPAEFYEILTAVKLAVLLRSNDKKIFETLGIPKKMNLSSSKIKIYIPAKANFPLIDYYLSISTSDQNETDALKVSVKSKVKSPATNTVKFSDIFETEKSVVDWHKSLQNSQKPKEKGQKIIAESAITAYKSPKYARKVQPGVPINAVLNLLSDSSQNQKIKSVIKKLKGNPTDKEIINFEKGLNVVRNNYSTFKGKDDLLEIIDIKKDELLTLQKIISLNRTTKGKPADPTLLNLGVVCEKILQYSSKKASPTQYNFYQMFFDEVLRKKELAYAVTKVSGGRLQYGFYSKVNFAKEYGDWIDLRSKATDVIGLSV